MKSIIVCLMACFCISCTSHPTSEYNKKDSKMEDPKTVETQKMIQALIKKVEEYPTKKNQLVLLPLDEHEKPVAIEVKNKIMIIQLLILQEAEMNKAVAIHDSNVNRIVASFMINENSYSRRFGETWVETMQKPARH